MGRGVFITFEGDDGVGKSTHVRLLSERLRAAGRDALCLREPGGTPISEALRAILLDPANEGMSAECELLIFEAARAQLVSEVLEPALAAGTVVLCDRFADSTVAYQAAGRGLAAADVRAANELATGGLEPDLTILLSIPDQGEKDRRIGERGAADRMELAGDGFHHRVSAAFARLPQEHPDRVVEVVAADSVDETAARIARAVAARFPDLGLAVA